MSISGDHPEAFGETLELRNPEIDALVCRMKRGRDQRFGITNDWPGRIMEPEMPLALWIAETDEPLRLAIADKLSPFFTT
jgi:hypothetical protein